MDVEGWRGGRIKRGGSVAIYASELVRKRKEHLNTRDVKTEHEALQFVGPDGAETAREEDSPCSVSDRYGCRS